MLKRKLCGMLLVVAVAGLWGGVVFAEEPKKPAEDPDDAGLDEGDDPRAGTCAARQGCG